MAISADVKITNNSGQIKDELAARIPVILEAIALEAEGNAVSEITSLGAVDTGRLRDSISHATDDDSAYVGTNVEYGPYVEFGTTRYKTPRPFLKNSIANYTDDYKRILEEGLK